MSTSPSWFDQDKFARLKKVGPKVALKPLGATSPSSEPVTNPPAPTKESSLLPDLKGGEPLPEKEESIPLPESSIGETAEEIQQSETSSPEEAKTIEPAPEEKESQSSEGAVPPPLPQAKEGESSQEAEGPMVPPVLGASQRLMTSQSVSLKTISKEIPSLVPPTPAPIRAPAEVSTSLIPTPTTDAKVLMRRTSPLPALKSINRPEVPPVTLDPSASLAVRAPSVSAAVAQSAEDLAAAWEKITQLNQDLQVAVKERDQAINENVLLRDQLNQADEQLALQDAAIEQTEAQERLQQERDDALADAKSLREELQQTLATKETTASSDELDQAVGERDLIRRQYTELREQFENLKQDVMHGRTEPEAGGGASSEELTSVRFQLTAKEKEVGTVRQQVSELENERDSLRLQLSAQRAEVELVQGQLTERAKELESARQESGGSSSELENLRQQLSAKEQELTAARQSGGTGGDSGTQVEIASLREQLEQAKEEASIPQRGLALSQKALKETRDALREATDASDLAKSSLENIKKENSTLVQQNMLLQAQHDQISRELSSVKAKLMAKG